MPLDQKRELRFYVTCTKSHRNSFSTFWNTLQAVQMTRRIKEMIWVVWLEAFISTLGERASCLNCKLMRYSTHWRCVLEPWAQRKEEAWKMSQSFFRKGKHVFQAEGALCTKVWWNIPVIPTLERWRQDCLKTWKNLTRGTEVTVQGHMRSSDSVSGLYLGISWLQSVMEVEGVNEISRNR